MRLIDAEAFQPQLEAVSEHIESIELVADGQNCLINEGIKLLKGIYRPFIGLIRNQPTIDATPTVHAHWEHLGFTRCSNCSTINDWETRYCPCCGAKMDEEAADE